MSDARPSLTPPPPNIIRSLIESAFAEDVTGAGDLTTDAVVPADAVLKTAFVSREAGRLAGLPWLLDAFAYWAPAVRVTPHMADGDTLSPGDVIAIAEGPARAVLTAERVALNGLSRFCGIASLTAAHVAAIAHTKARIAATRKTTPGLRALEHYAVRAGGGSQHRGSLSDAILIKDNHIAAAGGIEAALRAAMAFAGHMTRIAVEVDTLAQLDAIMPLGPDVVLLDNFSLADLRTAVARVDGRCVVEASGGVTLETVAAIAETGVDIISIGALTHSAPILDIGLDAVEA